MYFKRILYFFYYVKKLDWQQFKKDINFVSNESNKSIFSIWISIFASSIKYNISILEYFQFGFYKKSKEEKNTYAGTGYMYEYQLKMNPKKEREVLEDKIQFNKAYKSFIKHESISFQEAIANPNKLDNLLRKHKKIVLKDSRGQCGIGIEVLNSTQLSSKNLLEKRRESNNDMIESYIEQHSELASISNTGLNTIRIITQLTKDNKVELLGARLRITINSVVDNLAAGNVAAPIDIKTGIVNGLAIYSDITKPEIEYHPITKTKITGFQIPFWDNVLILARNAALFNRNNKSIGWDIAVTDEGPELLEGNHDWCKLLWQLPVKKGLKHKLEPFRLNII